MAALDPSRAMPPPAQQLAALKPLSKPDPMFPREATRSSVDRGRVMARLFVAPDGTVSKVEILSAQPPRVFEREVRETAMHWRYEAPGQPRQADVEFLFDRSKER
jgi:protein TonB